VGCSDLRGVESGRRPVAASSLTIIDNRTGKSYEIPITNGAIRAMDLRWMRTGPEDFGLPSHEPAFTNTASTISRITEIDGDRGILRYRGYPIEELAEPSNYLEVVSLADPEQKIARPRRLYLGAGKRGCVEIGRRDEKPGTGG